MQLIGTETGIASLILAWEEIRPLSLIPMNVVGAALTERYKFQYPPAQYRNYAEAQAAVHEFRSGALEHQDRLISVLGIIIYSDAIAVECSNTDDADIVLDNLMAWARGLGFREFIRPPQKLYGSRLVAKFDLPLERLFGISNDLISLMAASAESHYGSIQPFGMLNINFRADNRKVANSNLFSHFSFERRMNEPYDENRFVCSAPLSTSEHLTLLGQIEGLAKSKGAASG
jgi:hypothetical protein